MSLLNRRSQGPPYASPYASVGGLPTIDQDAAPTTVFLFLYVVGAVLNMTIFQLNRRKGHKFLFSGVLFGFCMSRNTTTTLRLVWATRPHNVRIAIAAGIFNNAGTLILYVVSLLFALRILRANQPRIGWHPLLRLVVRVFYGLLPLALIMVISVLVLSLYTLNEHTRTVALWIERGGITFLTIFCLLPLAMLLTTVLLPRSKDSEIFGTGSMSSKVLITTLATCGCVTIAGFRAGTTWMAPRLRTDPAWYDSKAAFYCFNFTIEIIILYTLIITRVDKRFHVPDGSRKAGDYSGTSNSEKLQRPDFSDGSSAMEV